MASVSAFSVKMLVGGPKKDANRRRTAPGASGVPADALLVSERRAVGGIGRWFQRSAGCELQVGESRGSHAGILSVIEGI